MAYLVSLSMRGSMCHLSCSIGSCWHCCCLFVPVAYNIENDNEPTKWWYQWFLFIFSNWFGNYCHCFATLSDFWCFPLIHSRHPLTKWAQRSDKVYITIELPDAKEVKLSLQPNGQFHFSATTGAENVPYEIDFELYDKVNVEVSIWAGSELFYCGYPVAKGIFRKCVLYCIAGK